VYVSGEGKPEAMSAHRPVNLVLQWIMASLPMLTCRVLQLIQRLQPLSNWEGRGIESVSMWRAPLGTCGVLIGGQRSAVAGRE
jgi:hypothetical protein